MQSISTSPFNLSILRKQNIWYTAGDGNWSNPNTWISNGKKKYNLPQSGDTVYVNHNMTMDMNIHVTNLYISGKISGTISLAIIITIDGDCQISGSGIIDLSLQSHNLILNGYNNIIPYNNFVCGNFSTVTYNATSAQNILNLAYRNLTTQNLGTKYQTSDLVILGTLNAESTIYEVGSFNLTVNGSSTLGAVGSSIFNKSGSGSLLFIGYADFEGVNMPGNPNVELRGGIQLHAFTINTGSGIFTFSTNNQNIDCNAYLGGSWNAAIIISGAITVTLTGASPLQINNTINGTVSGSTLNNTGVLYLGNNSIPMTTGVFNYQYSTTSTLGYIFNGSATLPYSTYANLVLSGTGTKTLVSNTTINKTFTNSGNLECNGFDLTVVGIFINQGGFTTNAFCNILFESSATFTVNVSSLGMDLRTGNPDVEFRNGLEVHTQSCYAGNGTLSFTTNNQTINFSAYNGGAFGANILISGAITIVFLGNTSAAGVILGTLNGDNVSSIFNNQGTFSYNNSQQPMQIGMLYCNQVVNTFIYGSLGNQDIAVPSDSTPGYQNLILSGSGVKKLAGNISVKGVYTLTSPATLNSNGYSLTNP